MEFIKESHSIKIIPKDVRGTANGYITNKRSDGFCADFECLNPNFFNQYDTTEVIIPYDTYLVSFKTQLLKIDKNTIEFSLPEKVRYIQRREFTRIDISIPVEIRELKTDAETSEESFSKNISGGGLQILASKKFQAGTKLEAKFKIFDNKSIESILEVLRVNNDAPSSNKFSISGKFIEISNNDRTSIIQLCFKKQLERNYKNIKSTE